MLRHPKTWILIADGARARILQYHGPGKPPTEVEGHAYVGDHSATGELMSDSAGRTHQSVGPGRSAIESHSDAHRELKVDFAKRLATTLDQELSRGAYDKLVIAAAPVTLGDLRPMLSDHVRKKIVGEVAMDLTKTPNSEVMAHLGGIVLA